MLACLQASSSRSASPAAHSASVSPVTHGIRTRAASSPLLLRGQSLDKLVETPEEAVANPGEQCKRPRAHTNATPPGYTPSSLSAGERRSQFAVSPNISIVECDDVED